MTWLRRIIFAVALVAGGATPVSAAPPPYPPDGPTIQGFYSLVSEYKGSASAARG